MTGLAKSSNIINEEIFRAYDIRGIIGKEWCLNGDYSDAYLIGRAIGKQLLKRDSPIPANIIIGRDGRLSSEGLSKKLIEGLLSSGCNVTDIGLVATPTVYFALSHLGIANSVMVTGSHNPKDHNGIKIVYESMPLSSEAIQSIYFDIIHQTEKKPPHPQGCLRKINNIISNYQHAIVDDIGLQKPLRIGIDSGNGATALFSESLFTRLGCEVFPLFCEVDGSFPNHSPDPTVPENLTALIQLVKHNSLDIGIAFDGDGDRMIAVDNEGEILWPDRIMILLAQNLLAKYPESPIVFDVKCSFLLPKAIQQYGGQPSMCISGHSYLKMQILKLNAIMGGEFSGHIVLPDRWSYFDDGPYVAARLLELLSHSTSTTNEVFKQIPNSYATPEYKIQFEYSSQAQQLLDQFMQHANFSGARLSLIDGIRVDYDDAWGLIRASNTTASLTIRFEALSEARLFEIQEQFRKVLANTDNNQELPF